MKNKAEWKHEKAHNLQQERQAVEPDSALSNHAANPSDVRKEYSLIEKTVRWINIQSYRCSHGRFYISSMPAHTDDCKQALHLRLCSLLRNPRYVSCTQGGLVAHYRLQRMNQAPLQFNTICVFQIQFSTISISMTIHNSILQYAILTWWQNGTEKWEWLVSQLQRGSKETGLLSSLPIVLSAIFSSFSVVTTPLPTFQPPSYRPLPCPPSFYQLSWSSLSLF